MEQLHKYSNKTFDDIVFEHRNKQYGSYVLRGIAKRNTFIGLSICSGLVGLLLMLYYLDFSFLKKMEPPLIIYPSEVTLSDPPPIFETLPPAVPPAAEKIKSDLLAEMEVKKDEEIKNKEDNPLATEKVDTTANGTSQNGINTNSTVTGNGKAVYQSVEERPQYPGGEKGLKKYLSDNLIYPEVAKENGIQGTVTVLFIVNEDGSVSDVKIQKGIGGGCDQEALRIVKEMRKWKPGKQGGQPVRVYQALPITFKLNTK